jgi:hypothetical protein
MAWIKTLLPTPENPRLIEVLQEQAAAYPEEYHPSRRAERRVPAAVANDSIVLSHSLIPEALRHAFGTFAAVMDPKLPLSRRQHEMIAATVSALNRCYY